MIPQYRIEQYLNAINAAYLGGSPLPEYPSEPVWRIEQFLAAILSAVKGDSPVMACPEPVWHVEEFARAIYDALTGASPACPCPTATNNIEAILRAIYKRVADGTETDGISTSWDIERWLIDSYDTAKEGGKNLLEPFHGTNGIGLQFAVQSDGSIKVSGTAASTGGAYMAETFSLPHNGIAVGDTITLWSDHFLLVRFLNSSSSVISFVEAVQGPTTVEVPPGTESIRVFEAVSFTNVTAGTVVNDTIRAYIAKANLFTAWSPYYKLDEIIEST